jgi:hypothetical protein
MRGNYSLIVDPYAPGVLYNRIFIGQDPQTDANAPRLDRNGLLFMGNGFLLNLFAHGFGTYILYRSDGSNGMGQLFISDLDDPAAMLFGVLLRPPYVNTFPLLRRFVHQSTVIRTDDSAA